MHDDEGGARRVAQSQQRVAERGHGAGIVFILIMGGIERVEDDDFGGGGLSGGEEVVQALRCTEQMAGGAGIHQQMVIGSCSQAAPHECQAADEWAQGQFKLADEHAARGRDRKSQPVAAGGQREGEIGNQQGFSHLGFAAHKENALGGQQPRLDQTRRCGGLLLDELGQREDGEAGRFGGRWVAHSRASGAASSRMASVTREDWRAAARRKEAKASLLTLRRMPLVA